MAVTGVVLGLTPVVPRTGAAAAPAPNPPAIFAATAEAWAYSAELGVPGPLGPLASHTTAAVDNSPHAQGAAGLADPGYLVRAAAGLVAGIPTPAYCESAWPEGSDHADCGAPGGGPTTVSSTRSGDGPRATSTAALADAAVPAGNGAASRQSRRGVAAEPPAPTVAAEPTAPTVAAEPLAPPVAADAAVLTVAAQSTTSSAFMAKDGVLHATADVVLSGVALAGGALRIGTLAVRRNATATGLPGGTRTTAAIELGGLSVGGNPVDLGSDPMRSLAQAVQQAFGATIEVEGLSGREEQPDEGKLVAESSGLRVTWRPQPDRSLRIVLGYGRVLVYATRPPSGESVPSGAVDVPGPLPGSPAAGTSGGHGPSADSASGGLGPPMGSGPIGAAAIGGGPASATFVQSALPGEATTARAAANADGSVPMPQPGQSRDSATLAEEAAGQLAPLPLLAGGRPLGIGTRPPVQWVSPFLVLAQMTTGRQAWWFLLGVAPLLAAAWLARRSGLGLVAPWAAGGRSGTPS